MVSEGGETLGTSVEFCEAGNNDVYVRKQGKKDIHPPATKEIVKHIDRKAKRMVIHLVDGLME